MLASEMFQIVKATESESVEAVFGDRFEPNEASAPAQRRGARDARVEVVAAPLEGVARRKVKNRRKERNARKKERVRALVHAEIAQPLTILRYYARPFLHRSLHSRAHKPAAILGTRD